jgi:hypothetical protein
MSESDFPVKVSVQFDFTLAIIGIYAMVTKPHRIQIAEHGDNFAGSIFHRGDRDKE